jgi:NAD+-dependent farnesol dehydrogenase
MTMILLTGATGYLGSAIAQELARRREPFRVLVRDPARLGFDPVAARCEVVLGDLRDAGAVARAMRGTSRVLHTAALVKMWVRDRRDFRRVNVEGLKLVCRAAAEAGVARIVYTSSFIALGPSSDVKAREGLQHRGSCSNEYEQTKVEALEWLRREGFRQFPVVALLPGVIYGPGPQTDGNLVGNMIRQYSVGRLPALIGSGCQGWSFAYIQDVAAAHLAALEKGETGQEYILGGDNRSLDDFYQTLARVSGLRRTVARVPFAVAKLLGAASLGLAFLSGYPPALTPGAVEIFKHDWVYSSEKAVRELGYHVTSLEEGLERTLRAS